jgi:hypothetical protein
MPPSPYFLWVKSNATQATEEQFVKWYKNEYLPNVIIAKASTRATFYQETLDFPGSAREHHERQWLSVDQGIVEPLNFLVGYQTKFKEMLKSKEYMKIPTTSDRFPWKSIADSGSFDVRNYKLVQDYDPNHIGEGNVLGAVDSMML